MIKFAGAPTSTTVPFHARTPMGMDAGLAWWVDEDKRLVTQVLRNETVSPANALIDRSCGYMDNRNLTAIADNLDATRNESYWYPPNGFLQNADGPWGSLTFYTDGAGNITHRIIEPDDDRQLLRRGDV